MDGMTLRVATWNLWWRFGPHERRHHAIVDTLRSIDADVLCLQEVWSADGGVDGGATARDDTTAAGGADQAEILGELLGMTVTRTAPIFFDGHAFGNAVLSRWPADLVADDRLPGADGTPGHRRVVAARVHTPWGPWPFASTHLDHRFDASATRQLQAASLLESVSRWRGDPERDLPLVIGGDFNAVPDSDEIRLLTGRRAGVGGVVMTDVWEVAGTGPGITWGGGNPFLADSTWPERRLDYLLVSWPRPKPLGNPVRAWLAGNGPVDVAGAAVWPSDHAAVVAELVTPA